MECKNMNIFFSNAKARETFENVSNDPNSYLKMADKLKLSADIILEEYLSANEESKKNVEMTDMIKIGLYPIYLMLIGYSFENVLKGLFIALGGKFLKWNSNGHNLEVIVTDINKISLKVLGKKIIENKKDETDLLKKLKVYAEGKGRYPTVKKIEDVKLDKYDVEGLFHPDVKGYNEKFETRVTHWYNPKELNNLTNGLFDRYRLLLEKRC